MYKTFLSLIFLFIFSGCASVPMSTIDKKFNKYKHNYAYGNIEVVKQSQDNSCGTACLASVMNRWGRNIDEEYLLTKYPKPISNGYSLVELSEIARNEGINAYGFVMTKYPKKQLEEQLLKGRPVICAVKFPFALYLGDGIPLYNVVYREITWGVGEKRKHYIVVFGMNKRNYLIMDPTYGIASLNKDKFLTCWKEMDCSSLTLAIKDNF